MITINCNCNHYSIIRFILVLSQYTKIMLPVTKDNEKLLSFENIFCSEIVSFDYCVKEDHQQHLICLINYLGNTICSLGPHLPVFFEPEKVTKDIDYIFIGKKSKEREIELKDYLLYCIWSNKGRTKKDIYDKEYFDMLARSKFVLCPSGECPLWTYRFYEAIFCKAIPVVTVEQYRTMYEYDKDSYQFYLTNNEHEYREDWVEDNYDTLLAFMEHEIAGCRNSIILRK